MISSHWTQAHWKSKDLDLDWGSATDLAMWTWNSFDTLSLRISSSIIKDSNLHHSGLPEQDMRVLVWRASTGHGKVSPTLISLHDVITHLGLGQLKCYWHSHSWAKGTYLLHQKWPLPHTFSPCYLQILGSHHCPRHCRIALGGG